MGISSTLSENLCLLAICNLKNVGSKKIACFILEPVSFLPPENGFLGKLKSLCEKNGTILIFDEVVSGFRFDLGGAQRMIGVTPHLSAFGKAMANGFSVSALVGQKEFMKLGGFTHDQERVFLLSTTHGGENHALAASIACIKEIIKHNAIEHFWHVGKSLKEGIRAAAIEVGAEKFINISGYDVKPAFSFNDEHGEISMLARTLFLQETVARGLMIPYLGPCFAHKNDDINFAIECVKDALAIMKAAAEGSGMASALRGEIVKPVFRKFN